MLSFANLVVAATVVGIAAAAPEPVVLVKHVDVYVCPSVENIVPFDANYGSGIIPSGIETCLGSQCKRVKVDICVSLPANDMFKWDPRS